MYHSRILIVDDEKKVTDLLQDVLEAEGFETLIASNGTQALEIANVEILDLMILDLMLPGIDGFEVLQRRAEWPRIPVIVLSGRREVVNKVKCLDRGADDYIEKPFALSELVARVKATLRRSKVTDSVPTQSCFISGDLEINFSIRRVIMAGNEIRLPPTEYRLLQELALNEGKVLTHSHLLNRVWGPEYSVETQYLHVYVSHLRHKIEPDPKHPKYIVTIPGVGYMFQNI